MMPRMRRSLKPDATPSCRDANGNIFSPPMTLTPSAVWELGERMARAMNKPVKVLIADDSSNTYREVDAEEDLATAGNRVAGVRLVAGGGPLVKHGELFSDGSVGMNFDFPANRPGNASLFRGG